VTVGAAMQLDYSYRDSGSPLHRLHALVWLVLVAAVIVATLVLQHPVLLVCVLAANVVLALSARVWKQWWGVMRFTIWMFLLVVAINAIVSNEGSHVLWAAGFRLPLVGEPRVTLEALAYGAAMGVRLSTVISAFTLLNLCVHPDDMMRAAIKARLPYRSVLVTSLSTRFIPVLLSDANTIMDVQRSRGVDFSSGRLSSRVRNYGALVLPLLSNSLDRAVQVAEAMESRGYGARGERTFYKDRRIGLHDGLAALTPVAALCLVVLVRLDGIDEFAYYPTLSALNVGVSLAASAGLLMVLLLAPAAIARLHGGYGGD